jgi:hypothetical protein
MPTTNVHNTFEYGVETTLMQLLTTYLAANLSITDAIKVVRGESSEVQHFPRVIVSTADTTEEVFQSGIYRAKVEVTIRVDLDIQPIDVVGSLFAAVLDCLQQTDLETQMTLAGLVTVKLAILGPSKLEGLGDRYSQKVQEIELIGFAT